MDHPVVPKSRFNGLVCAKAAARDGQSWLLSPTTREPSSHSSGSSCRLKLPPLVKPWNHIRRKEGRDRGTEADLIVIIEGPEFVKKIIYDCISQCNLVNMTLNSPKLNTNLKGKLGLLKPKLRGRGLSRVDPTWLQFGSIQTGPDWTPSLAFNLRGQRREWDEGRRWPFSPHWISHVSRIRDMILPTPPQSFIVCHSSPQSCWFV